MHESEKTERHVWHAYGIVCALAERINYNALENYLKCINAPTVCL